MKPHAINAVCKLCILVGITIIINRTIFKLPIPVRTCEGKCGVSNVEMQPMTAASNMSDSYQIQEELEGGDVVVPCTQGVPYEFKDEVDFRIIVMTFTRTKSLLTLLNSLNDLVVGNDSISLAIFVDRNKRNEISNETLQAALDFQWKLKGQKQVLAWKKHAGLYGQWIDSWRPKPSSKEIALILEDDISVSPWAYQWLKAAHSHYGSRKDISGYTLQSEKVRDAIDSKPVKASSDDTTFMYKVLGSWGFSPHPTQWKLFQDWFHEAYSNKSFRPYVPGIKLTNWYKGFEKAKTADGMWTMWFTYFTDKHDLFCVYNNLGPHTKFPASYLGQHRREPGLHYKGKGGSVANKLLGSWEAAYVRFPRQTKKFDYAGKEKSE